MCGRYTLSTPGQVVAEHFRIDEEFELAPRYNIAPTEPAPVVRGRAGERTLDLLRWGLVPFWADDPSIGARMINARAETAAEKPAFRESLEGRRCLVPADGFYEWETVGRRRQPYLWRLRTGEPFAFAGLWARWRGDDGPLESFTVLTTDANPLVARVHDRMPVIVPPTEFDRWLDPEADPAATLAALARPYPEGAMIGYPVSTYVNKAGNDSPRCLEPVERQETLPGF